MVILATRTTNKQVSNRSILPIEVGPWPSGLNNREGDFGFRDIADDELLSCSNMDIHESGILQNRNGFARYDLDYFPTTINDSVGNLQLRNVLGSVIIDTNHDEGIVQFYDTTHGEVYLLRTSILSGGESSDFNTGYWVKKAISAGADFFLTSVTRYNSDIYFTSNNSNLGTETSTFVGGFFLNNVTVPTASNFLTLPVYTGGAKVGLPVDIMGMVIDSGNNIYLLSADPAGTANAAVIYKVTSGGSLTTFFTGLSIYVNTTTFTGGGYTPGFACDGTNLYVTTSATSNYYNSQITKITSGAVSSVLIASTNLDHYGPMAYDSNTLSLIVVNVNISSGSNVVKHLSILASSSAITVLFSGVPGSGSFIWNSVAVTSSDSKYANPGTSFPIASNNGISKLDPTAGFVNTITRTAMNDTVAGMINDLQATTYDGLYVTNGVSTSGIVYKINVTTGTISPYFTNMNSPTFLVEDSGNNLFVQEQSKITKLVPTSAGTLTAITTMPFGDTSFIFKDRMWIVDKTNSRMHYSKATDPTDWNTADDAGFFDVNPGDGESITDVVISTNQMFIFKESGTWRFTFTADPGATNDGVLAVLSRDRGAYSACVYNNVTYLVGQQGVQRLVNGAFIDISQQIRDFFGLFNFSSNIDYIENKLIVTLQSTNPGDPHALVMNLLTGAWSTYDISDIYPGTQFPIQSHLFKCGVNSAVFTAQNGAALAVGGLNNISSDNAVSLAGTVRSLPAVSAQTKFFDFDTPLRWKKLTRLSLDVLSTFYDYEAEDTPYPITLTMTCLSPTQTDVVTMVLNETATSPDMGPDQFPFAQVLQDLTTNQPFSAHRFQVISFTLSAALAVPLSSAGNAMEIVFKRINSVITQKSSKGDDATI